MGSMVEHVGQGFQNQDLFANHPIKSNFSLFNSMIDETLNKSPCHLLYSHIIEYMIGNTKWNLGRFNFQSYERIGLNAGQLSEQLECSVFFTVLPTLGGESYLHFTSNRGLKVKTTINDTKFFTHDPL